MGWIWHVSCCRAHFWIVSNTQCVSCFRVNEHAALKCVRAPGSEATGQGWVQDPTTRVWSRAPPDGQFLGSCAHYVLYCIVLYCISFLLYLFCDACRTWALVQDNRFCHWAGDPLSLLVLKIIYSWRGAIWVVGPRHVWVVDTLNSVFPCEDPGPTGTEAICIFCELLVGEQRTALLSVRWYLQCVG